MIIMKKTVAIMIWGIVITALFFSIFYVIVSGVTSYFIYPVEGSILRETKLCKPVWVSIGLFSEDSLCLEICQAQHGVTNYKIENLKCFCDINNCKAEE